MLSLNVWLRLIGSPETKEILRLHRVCCICKISGWSRTRMYCLYQAMVFFRGLKVCTDVHFNQVRSLLVCSKIIEYMMNQKSTWTKRRPPTRPIVHSMMMLICTHTSNPSDYWMICATAWVTPAMCVFFHFHFHRHALIWVKSTAATVLPWNHCPKCSITTCISCVCDV